MTDAYVLGGVRTPIGRYGGSLSHIRTDDLLGQAMVWACERVGVELDRIEDGFDTIVFWPVDASPTQLERLIAEVVPQLPSQLPDRGGPRND